MTQSISKCVSVWGATPRDLRRYCKWGLGQFSNLVHFLTFKFAALIQKRTNDVCAQFVSPLLLVLIWYNMLHCTWVNDDVLVCTINMQGFSGGRGDFQAITT